MRYLISGGLGFVGSNFAKYLVSRGDSVLVTTRKSTACKRVDSKVEILETDCTDIHRLSQVLPNIDTVIHCAGLNALQSKKEPARALKYKTDSTQAILEAAQNVGSCKLLYISSVRVLDINKSAYAVAHQYAEQIILGSELSKSGMVQIVRLPNTVGAPGYPQCSPNSDFVTEMIRSVLATGVMNIQSEVSTKRDFASIASTTKIVIESGKTLNLTNLDAINLPTITLSLGEMACLINEVLKRKYQIMGSIFNNGIPLSKVILRDFSRNIHLMKGATSEISQAIESVFNYFCGEIQSE